MGRGKRRGAAKGGARRAERRIGKPARSLSSRYGLPIFALVAVGALYLIPVPGFLEAQTRSKTTRVRSEFRELAETLRRARLNSIAWPDALPETRLTDPFSLSGQAPYGYWISPTGAFALLSSVGPDNEPDIDPAALPADVDATALLHEVASRGWLYDPTNGILSAGDLAVAVGAPTANEASQSARSIATE